MSDRGPASTRCGSVRARFRGLPVAAALVLAMVATGTVDVGNPLPASAAADLCGAAQPLTGAAAATTRGITKSTVTVGNVSIISGPVPGLFEGAPIGTEAYFDYVNAHGGVEGRTLHVTSMDDGFNGAQNLAETQQAVSNDFALVGSFSLFDNYGCKALADNPAVPDVSVTLDPTTNALPNVYSAQPIGQGIALGPFLYLKKRYPHSLALGALVSNAATALAQWQGQKVGLEHAGYKIAYFRSVNPLETDFTADIVNMRNRGVQTLYMTDLDWPVSAALIQDLTQQGWRPQVIFSGGPAYADQFIHTAGGSPANGVWIGQLQSLYLGQDSRSVPADKTFLTWVQRAHPGWTPDLFTLYGWSSAQLFVDALRAAGPNPTRGKVLAALHKITRFDASGLLAPSNPAKKISPSCYIIARVVSQRFQRVADPPSGFRCDAPDWGIDNRAHYGPT